MDRLVRSGGSLAVIALPSPLSTKADWKRYGLRQGWVRVDAEHRHGARLELVAWDELSDDVQDQLRRLAERVG